MKPHRFLIILLGLLLVIGSMKAEGGDVLDRIIRLPRAKGTVYALLGKVSEQSGYLFVYDSKIVNNDAVVKTKGKKCTVRQAIYEIIGNKRLELKVIGQHILILPPAEKIVRTEKVAEIPQSFFFTITGTLRDKETGEPVSNASVIVQGTSIGNISNKDGEFRLHLPDSLKNSSLSFSHLGYMAQTIEAATLVGRDNVLNLEPKVVPLQEVLIRLVEPKKLLREMLERREDNYSLEPIYLTTFYREGVQLKNKFQSLTEAVFKVYKTSLKEKNAFDQVKLLKMSRIDNRESSDSLVAKIRAGIQACLQLDIMKDLPDFFSVDELNNPYVYTSGDITFIDDRCVNVVYFEQKSDVKEPLYCGALYIDSENGALVQARIEMQPKYIKKATRIFVVRQAPKVNLTAQKIEYTISYKPWNGTYYIHHIRGDQYFRMKRKRAFSSNPILHTWFEMVTCRVDNENVTRFPRAERLPTRTVLAEEDFRYDKNFWEDFNVIPLEEELSKIIEKVALKIEKIGPQEE
ncbi:carboxypeptidase-like regulatory domain-containing protein [uncultured Bacteroides sp.]|uniref:carboxypeptidase-like regulatory domain-containing protein n=1 Tax=uncultured Bacteroides sp. TaxID=162156 RepID=UPI0025F3622B|nr:carboxypeptidase-like regulatory domain-containing protein [uncultured Bacteroides sp.]